MVMFTQLLRYEVADARGERSRIADLCISLLEDDYPPITHMLFEYEGELRQRSWDGEVHVDWSAGRIEVDDLDAARARDPEKDVLLRRDIMDALVLDLLGRRTTRVCDLWLHDDDGSLRLKGVDAGLMAMIRRITGGRIGKTDKASLFDWKYVEFLRGDPGAVARGAGYRLRINRLPAGEIARLADYVPYLHAAELISLLPDKKAADVLQAMSLDRQLQVIDELPEEEAVDLLERMAPDLAADLAGRLDVATMKRYLNSMSSGRREKVVELLRYPEDSVGGVMTNDLALLDVSMSTAEAQERVRGMIEDIDLVTIAFVLDEVPDGKLRGSIPLRTLLAAPPDAPVEDLMDPYISTLDPFEKANDAAYRIASGQLEAMPVVTPEGRLVGAMTIAAAITQLVPAGSGLQGVRVFT